MTFLVDKLPESYGTCPACRAHKAWHYFKGLRFCDGCFLAISQEDTQYRIQSMCRDLGFEWTPHQSEEPRP